MKYKLEVLINYCQNLVQPKKGGIIYHEACTNGIFEAKVIVQITFGI